MTEIHSDLWWRLINPSGREVVRIILVLEFISNVWICETDILALFSLASPHLWSSTLSCLNNCLIIEFALSWVLWYHYVNNFIIDFKDLLFAFLHIRLVYSLLNTFGSRTLFCTFFGLLIFLLNLDIAFLYVFQCLSVLWGHWCWPPCC